MNYRLRNCLVFLLAVLCACSTPEKRESISEIAIRLKAGKATLCYQRDQYGEAVSILEKLVREYDLNPHKKERIGIAYDLACNHALLGNTEKALSCLEKAVSWGYADAGHIETDPDLELIRGNEKYKGIIFRLKRKQGLWNNPFIQSAYHEDLDENEKIAGLSRLWSEIKFNFINFDQVPDINPDSLYVNYLPRVRRTKSTFDYYRVLQAFCVHFRDGHTEVNLPKALSSRVNGRVPLQTRLVEDRVIITKVYDKRLMQKGVVPGVEITHVDGYEAKVHANKFIRPYWTSNSEHGRNRTLFEYAFLRGPVGKPVEVRCRTALDERFAVELPRLKRIPAAWEPVVYRRLENNIGYLNIKSFYDDEIVTMVDSVFSSIMETDALVIDLRENGGGNGRVGWRILGYFTDKPFQIFAWKTRMYRPIWRAWGLAEEIYEESPAWRHADGKVYYRKPVVLLTRVRTASMAENFCMGFRILKRGKIIGGPTAGSSGTPLFFALPGGGTGQVVTTKSYFPDGTGLIGRGVEPDIEVYPTIEDFRSGRDRILETAVDYLKKNRI